MKKFLLFYIFSLFTTKTAFAQLKHDFAMSYVGVQRSQLEIDDKAFYQDRFVFGAIHFFEHLDFYFAVPLNSGGPETSYDEFSHFNVNFYPFKIKANSIRPFIGYNLSSRVHIKKGGETLTSFTNDGLKYGLGIRVIDLLLEIGVEKPRRRKYDYYENMEDSEMSALGAEKLYASLKFLKENSKKSSPRINRDFGLTVSIGATSSEQKTNSQYIENNKPWIGAQNLEYPLLPEIGVGFTHFNSNISANIFFRDQNNDYENLSDSINTSIKTYGLDLMYSIHFFYGFRPFVGFSIQEKNILYQEFSNSIKTISENGKFFTYGMNYGWEIKPIKTHSFFLRHTFRSMRFQNRPFSTKPYRFEREFFEAAYISGVFQF